MATETVNTDLPKSFEFAMAKNYLGDPKVVAEIVGRFAHEISGWLVARGNGTMTQEQAMALFQKKELEFSVIFSGQNKGYAGVQGWNSPVVGLFMRLRADLGQYWIDHHEKHSDDAYRVLYGWLVWFVFDCMQKGANDDTGAIMETMLETGLKKMVRNLTGTDKRQT